MSPPLISLIKKLGKKGIVSGYLGVKLTSGTGRTHVSRANTSSTHCLPALLLWMIFLSAVLRGSRDGYVHIYAMEALQGLSISICSPVGGISEMDSG